MQHFPPELIRLIVRNVEDVEDLRRLSKTCRVIHEIAQPYLWESVDLSSIRYKRKDRHFLLVNALVKQPGIAKHIKHLYLGRWHKPNGCVDVKHFHCLDLADMSDETHIRSLFRKRINLDLFDALLEGSQDAAATIILMMATELQHLSFSGSLRNRLETGRLFVYKFLKQAASDNPRRNQKLLKLKSLDVRRFRGYHESPSAMSEHGLALPSLKTFACRNTTMRAHRFKPMKKLSKVEKIELERVNTDLLTLRRILQSPTKLRSLILEIKLDMDKGFSLPAFMDLLQPHKETLEELDLRILPERALIQGKSEWAPTLAPAGSLFDFDEVKELTVDQHFLLGLSLDPNVPRPEAKLSMLIPSTCERLHIFAADVDIIEPLQELAVDVYDGLTSLQSVNIYSVSSNTSVLSWRIFRLQKQLKKEQCLALEKVFEDTEVEFTHDFQ